MKFHEVPSYAFDMSNFIPANVLLPLFLLLIVVRISFAKKILSNMALPLKKAFWFEEIKSFKIGLHLFTKTFEYTL